MTMLLVRVGLLFCLVLPIAAYSLYAIGTEWGPDKNYLYTSTVKIDRTTGVVTNLTVDAFSYDFGGPYYGISAFDDHEGRIFYVGGRQGPVRSSDVLNKRILPSMTIDVDAVFALDYDTVGRKLYVLFQLDEWYFLLQAGPQTARYVLMQFPSTANWSPRSGLDAKSGTYYMISAVNITKTPDYRVYTIDIASGEITHTVKLDGRSCPGPFIFTEFDNTTGDILGVGRSATSRDSGWFFFRVEPQTGRCSRRLLPQLDGVAVDTWAYDSRAHELLYIQFTETEQLLGTFHIRSGTFGSPVVLPRTISIANMEVSLLH